MRTLFHPILALAWCTLVLAQKPGGAAEPTTNVPPPHEETPVAGSSGPGPAAVPAPTRPETHIFSDNVELGIKTRSAVYRGHVRLEDPRLHLTCEELTADVPEEGSRVERVVARTNVVVLLIDEKGRTNRAFADQVVYTYSASESRTNELVEFTGDPAPRIERQEGTLYGDVIIWDRVKNQIRATNQRMIYRADPLTGPHSLVPAHTNLSAADAAPAHE